MDVLCKCGKKLLDKGNKTDYTIIVSAVDNVIEVIDCYKCESCKTVISHKKQYDKEVVLTLIKDLDCNESIDCISGNIKYKIGLDK